MKKETFFQKTSQPNEININQLREQIAQESIMTQTVEKNEEILRLEERLISLRKRRSLIEQKNKLSDAIVEEERNIESLKRGFFKRVFGGNE